MSLGTDIKLVGTVSVPLKDLVIKNYEVDFGTSAVVSTNCVLQGALKNEILGTISLKFRMRHPIIEALRWYREKNDLIGDRIDFINQPVVDPTITNRRIVVNVIKCRGLDPRSNTFVYYRFFNSKDTYSAAMPGREPHYDALTNS